MNQNPPVVDPSRSARLLHAALAGGLALAGVVFALSVAVLKGPLGDAPIPAVAFAAVALAQIGVALAVFRPRIPARRFDQSAEDYWSSSEVRGRSVVVWALLEGAGLFAAVGYVLTGGIAAAAVALIALVALLGVRPLRLEGEGAA